MTTAIQLVTPSALRWCQDAGRVLVIDEQSGLAVNLAGFDAAVWKWFGLSYPYADVLEFAQVYLDLPAAETRARLNQLLTGWVETGLLVEEAAP